MLIELSISNFAIIESLHLQFGPGFIVFTGETGAGKSIIIDAVSLLLGERASRDLIRTGYETATLEGIFVCSPELLSSLQPFLEEQGLYEGSDELILRREIRRDSRNRCRVNGHAVPLNTLQEIGARLVDIHGQGDHLSLLRVRNHVDFVDQFGELTEQRQAFGALVHELRDVRDELHALRQDERELARRQDLLTYEIEEIENADLRVGEDEELRRESTLLANAEDRMELASRIYGLLYEGEETQPSVMDLMGLVVDNVDDLAALDDALGATREEIEGIFYQLQDVGRGIRAYRDEVEYDPEGLERVQERLELIRSLKRKYGDSIEEILVFAEEAQEELEAVTHSEERIEALAAREKTLLQEIAEAGQALSAAREKVSQRLSQVVEAELDALDMEGARFLIDKHWQEVGEGGGRDTVKIEGKHYAFDATGLDRLAFLIAPNPGEEPKPLTRIASGGETSRLMLALKTALSSADPVPILIFDEIDAGIGGRAGRVVGEKLRTLANDHQVFCVTHLPQIALYGSQHFRVSKETARGRTLSMAEDLSYAERVEELAIMLGGRATETTRQSAQELLAPFASVRERG
ncbi:MAG: DNA repair protein RecN [Chloroflexota bacterium]|nr:DNA repair protein RecN [Chloroflexota bacterium]